VPGTAGGGGDGACLALFYCAACWARKERPSAKFCNGCNAQRVRNSAEKHRRQSREQAVNEERRRKALGALAYRSWTTSVLARD
jgi:hypothetical protein